MISLYLAIEIEHAEPQNATAVLRYRALRWAELRVHTFGHPNNYAFGAVAATLVVYRSIGVDWPKLRLACGQRVVLWKNKGWRSTRTTDGRREKQRLRL